MLLDTGLKNLRPIGIAGIDTIVFTNISTRRILCSLLTEIPYQHLYQNCVCAVNSCALVRTLLCAHMCRVCAVVGTNTTNIDCVAYFSLCPTQEVPEYRIEAVEV